MNIASWIRAWCLISKIFLIFLLHSGCGSGGKALPTSGSEIEGSQFGLIGSWEGILINKTPSNIESASLLTEIQEVPISVQFDGKSDQQGAFLFSLKNSENAVAKGNFKNFAGKSLILTIVESNVSSLGLTGSNTDFPYELIGNNLLLSNDRMTLKLTRLDPQANKETSADGESLTKGYFSRWRCEDSLDKIWLLNIKEDKKFTLDITSTNLKRKFLWLDGRLESEQNNQFLLIVEHSENLNYVGLVLVGELLSEGSLLIRRRAADDKVNFEKIRCIR